MSATKSRNEQISVLGSVNTDLVIRGPRLPLPGETVIGGELLRAGGGKGANQAVAAARLSRQGVSFIGAVGDDTFGRDAREGLAREGINCDHLQVLPGESTGMAFIMVDAKGENIISVASGANTRLTSASIDRVPDPVFRSARVFLTCLEVPVESVVKAIERAWSPGTTIILNPAPALPEVYVRHILERIDVITPNQHEARTLTGLEVSDVESAIFAARRFQALGSTSVVVTMGSSGCVVVEKDATHIPAVEARVVDTTAAGDAFNGALAVALAEGRTLVEAARWATRAAAIAVTRQGAQPSLPHRAELE